MNNSPIWPIVTAWGEGQPPSSQDYQKLIDWELGRADQALAWKIDAENVRTVLAARAQVLQSLHNNEALLPLPGSWQTHTELLWTFWLPFAQQLNAQQKALGRPFVQGILGGQGTGKTTLTQGLNVILSQMGQTTARLSLDDLYLSYRDRLTLQQSDPRLLWRGPPGTHDIELGLRTLNTIKTAAPSSQISLPQFDKSLHEGQGDHISPILMPAPSIFFFEGWFVGAMPLDDALFADLRIALPSPIETSEDRQFARDMNRRLQQYQPLWATLDSLLVLLQEDYRLSYDWRLQAEQQMRASGKAGLSDEKIASFVTYFWKALHPELFISPLADPAGKVLNGRPKASLVVKVGQGHALRALYSP